MQRIGAERDETSVLEREQLPSAELVRHLDDADDGELR
jgi:hypothetical protein